MTGTPNGNVQDSCAPTAEEYQAPETDEVQKKTDADAQHQARSNQAADHQIEHHAVAAEAAAEGEPGEERNHDGNDGDDQRELDRTINEPFTSPVRTWVNRSTNQCSDRPFIGKTSPPRTSWNNRM